MFQNVRLCLLGGGMLLALPAGAFAQTVAGGEATQPQAAPLPARQDTSGLEDIVVTAQKRSENVQSVPITITALSAKTLASANIRSTRDLSIVTPGLSFTPVGATASPTIRGVATRGTGPGDEPSVPIYIDGVYQSSPYGGFFKFNNIDRIEVLKGPQGTLFGRNAEGGVVNVITAAPKFKPAASGDISYASYNAVEANLYGTTPLTDKLAVNLALHADRADGYINNLTTGNKDGDSRSAAARAKLLWKPSGNVALTLGGNYITSNDNTLVSIYPLNGNTIDKRLNPSIILAGHNQTTVPDDHFYFYQVGAYGNLVVNLTGVDVSLLQSWTKTNARYRQASSATALISSLLQYPELDTSYTTELRFTSAGNSKFSWIAGLNYYDGEGSYGKVGEPFISRGTLTGATTTLVSTVGSRAYSGFGEITYAVTPKLSLTAGARYTYEHRTKDFSSGSTPFSALPNLAVPVFIASGSHNYKNISARASIKYEIVDRVHSYFTFSQGFKSGFPNASSVPTGSPPSFAFLKPETLDNFEAGVKSDLSGTLRVNVSAFYIKYRNLQVTVRSPTPPSATLSLNAGAAENYGGEISINWQPAQGLQINAGLANQHARYTSFPNSLAYFPATSTDTTTNAANLALNSCQPGTGALIGGNRAATCDSKGKRLLRSPDWTASISPQYTSDHSWGQLQVGGAVSYISNFIWDLYGTVDNGGSYVTVNAQIGWTSPDGRLSAKIFGENLTNSRQPILRFPSAAATYAVDQRPIRFGLQLGFKID